MENINTSPTAVAAQEGPGVLVVGATLFYLFHK